MARIDGVDLSHYQGGALDFPAAKRGGVKFVVHKATEGARWYDPLYVGRRKQVGSLWRRLLRRSLVFGAYHFAHPDSSAADQARHFLATAKPNRRRDLRPMLDLESTGGLAKAELTRWVLEFNQVVKQATGDDCLLYTNYDLGPGAKFLPRWAARYSDSMMPPNPAEPWGGDYAIWQFSDGRYGSPSSAPGIGHCDLNTLAPGVTLDSLTIGHRRRAYAAKRRAARRAKRVEAVRAHLTKANARLATVKARVGKIRARLARLVKGGK